MPEARMILVGALSCLSVPAFAQDSQFDLICEGETKNVTTGGSTETKIFEVRYRLDLE